MVGLSACETVFACLAHNDDGSTFADDFDVAGEISGSGSMTTTSTTTMPTRRRRRQRRRPGLDGS
jgi:hypothetical protein